MVAGARQVLRRRHRGGERSLWASLIRMSLLSGLLVAVPLSAQPAELAKGNFLVASRSLHDPNFVHAVILLVEYGSDGAMGIIINRPTKMALSIMLPDIESLERRTDTVWLGGPVSRWQMFLLTRTPNEIEGSTRILEDLYLSASRILLESLVEEETDFRVYAGYAGWSPGQLEHEVARGSWHILPGEAAMVFDEAPEELWQELVQRADVKWVRRGLVAAGLESRAR